ncbi:MAG: apolipoprotein N-acyltransferase [Bacillota bacterium]
MSYYLTILAGILLGIPFLIPQLALLSWIGLVPFLIAIEKKSLSHSFRLGWLLGVIFLATSSKWLLEPIINFSGYPVGIAGLIFLLGISILALYFALFSLVLKYLEENFDLSLIILVPLTWTGVEFLRSLFSFQFLFGFLGYSQSFIPELIQLARFGGVYLITFIIVVVNTLIYLAWHYKSRKNTIIYLSIAVLILFTIFFHGKWQLKQELPTAKDFKVSIVQPNIPQYKKLDADYQGELVDKLIKLSRNEINTNQADLLVWPETAILKTYSLEQKFPYLNNHQTPLFVGGFIRQGNGPLNSALLVDETGKIINRYSKNRLVPWGEYVPYPSIIPDFIETNLNHITPGTEAVEFELKGANWIGAICSEILNPDYIRNLYQQNDFIINISNEAWFGNSSASRQILQAAIFRAIEMQTPIVKAGNTGISGLINARGRVIEKTKLLTTKTLMVDLDLPARKKTVYYLLGDIVGKGSLILTMILLLIIAYPKLKNK